jgi:hypothetical protein
VKSSVVRLLLFLFLALGYAACVLPRDKAEKLSAEEIVAKHVEAIGAPETRSAIKSRTGDGTAEFNERISGRLHLPGTAAFLSQDHKVKWTFRFGATEYPGEQLVFDGQAVHVAGIDAGNRSRLGNFILDHTEVLREGLWGGVLSSGWALLNLPASGAKVKGEGTKTVDGRELYDLSYVPKGSKDSQLSIHLYFEPNTFRHVLTVYRFAGTQGPGGGPSPADAIAGEVVTVVEERFNDFHTTDGMTLPAEWEIRLRIEPSKGFEYQWKIHFTKLAQNIL